MAFRQRSSSCRHLRWAFIPILILSLNPGFYDAQIQPISMQWTHFTNLNELSATAKLHYGTSLSNVDWLHGGAESLLTLTNLFIVFGLRNALQKSSEAKDDAALQEEENVPLSK